MIQYNSLKILLVVEFLHSIQGGLVSIDTKTQKPSTDSLKLQVEHLLNLTITNKSLKEEDRKIKDDDKIFPEDSKDTAEIYYDKQAISKSVQVNQIRVDNIDIQNETLVIETGNKDTFTSRDTQGTQKNSQHFKNKDVPKDLKKIHKELQEVSLEEIELPYYTKPMHLVTTEKHPNDVNQPLVTSLLPENTEVQKQHITTQQENQVQQLNEDKKHLLKDNEYKENQIKKLEVEKKKLVKIIIDSIDNVVKDTKNNTEKKDLKELKTIIEILGDVESSKESAKETVLTTAKPPPGLLYNMKVGRKADGGQLTNIFSPEDMTGFAEALQQGKHIGRAYVEFTTRDIEKENDRKEKHRKKVKYNLDAWLKNRELLHPTIADEFTTRKFIEKCENWGWTRDKYKNIMVRPCCKFCCRKSYLGCK